jgi:ribosomal 50S subunit-recycling heat shock protein
MAVGGTHVQNAQRGDWGSPWGRVHVNGERVKPSKLVRTGDTIEVTVRTVRRTLVVTGVAERPR